MRLELLLPEDGVAASITRELCKLDGGWHDQRGLERTQSGEHVKKQVHKSVVS